MHKWLAANSKVNLHGFLDAVSDNEQGTPVDVDEGIIDALLNEYPEVSHDAMAVPLAEEDIRGL